MTDAPLWDQRDAWFREVFERYARYVWRVLFALGVPEKDVEDASQQVFLVVHRKLARVDTTAPVRTFLYAICLRVASDFRRLASSKRERLVGDVPEQSVGASQESDALHREALERLQRTLKGIDSQKRDVFVLYEIEGLEMQEIAGIVGCPLQTAYSRLHAARKAIYAAYERMIVEPSKENA